jgi:hypothetical protein
MLKQLRKTWLQHKKELPPSKELAVYGDSFVDPNCSAVTSLTRSDLAEHYYISAWSTQLVAHYSPEYTKSIRDYKAASRPHVYGRSGASNWYTYQRFLDTHHLYKRIVWVWTNKSRWPHLPKGLEGHNFNTTNMHTIIEKQRPYQIDQPLVELLEQCNGVYPLIFTDELLDFINAGIFLDVQQRCRSRGIALVNITIDDDHTSAWPATDYPMLRGLNNVSWREQSGVDDQLMRDIINEQFLVEMRSCHLNAANNRLLCQLVVNHLDQNSACYRSLPDDYTWDWSVDPLVQEFYSNYKQLVSTSK